MNADAVLDLIDHHASIRDYTGVPVAAELVERIVAAAQRASTSSNLQMYSVVAVTDRGRRERLAAMCGGQHHIVDAPVFLAWCADLSRLDRVCELRGYSQITRYLENFLVAAVDVALAAQTAALAAESLGLGICYIGAIRNDAGAVVRELALPRLVFPVTGMTVGWPARPGLIRPRLGLDAVLHWESYDTSRQDAALTAYDRVMIESGIYRGRQIAGPEGGDVLEAYGWLEHSARRASQPARTGLRSAVESQGFDLK